MSNNQRMIAFLDNNQWAMDPYLWSEEIPEDYDYDKAKLEYEMSLEMPEE